MHSSWEQFETTGKIEDYLRYRKQEKAVTDRADGAEATTAICGCDQSLYRQKEKDMIHGTDSGTYRAGVGRICVR